MRLVGSISTGLTICKKKWSEQHRVRKKNPKSENPTPTGHMHHLAIVFSPLNLHHPAKRVNPLYSFSAGTYSGLKQSRFNQITLFFKGIWAMWSASYSPPCWDLLFPNMPPH